ncbi:MAG: polyphosphate kinase 1 [Pseudomonadales bacterium]|jgi:polyphosphate kinase|nr:polyphosphate kinase 1 [Pseudomonadales bacterium]MBL6807527.1 polyphosphate kinase 1 [Pseudomonadales bacterium]MDA0954694.1 polyphosphate kinase 1 [Pseudomonadota bacterium]
MSRKLAAKNPAEPALAALFFNRELSLLEFNRRVLEQAKDDSVPLLERLFFLCIAASNLDEFFEIRVAGLKQQLAYGATQRGPDNLSPSEQLQRISERVHSLVDEQYQVLNNTLIPALEAEHIRFIRRADWSKRHADWIKRYFARELVPVLSPIALDPAHPFPRVLNKSLNFIVTLEGKDAFGRNSGMAIVGAPRSLPRLVALPESVSQGPSDFVFLSSIIHQHVSDLFPGMKATGCYQFRVTRNSDLFVDEEEIDDLKRALEGELSARRFGDEVRLELADDCPEEVEEFLVRQFELEESDVYRCNGPVNLTRLMAIPDMVDRPDLKYPGFASAIPPRVRRNDDIFEVIRRGDLLLHHPFESFAPVIDFLRQAARDPNVLAIRQTLYRTGADSAIVKALVDAARRGKEVTVVVELRARFDEEANIGLADALTEAGAHVVYGVVGHKTHSKMMLVVRREGRLLRRYVHLGTGNYHARTARLYTDYGLFTCDAAIGDDVQKMFQQLTAMGRVARLKKLIQAPFNLHKHMVDLVNAEAERARSGGQGRIIAKMNSLVEPEIIQALYAASQAGVLIDLIVRGVCCLRPGVEGVSENITVRSIIGRFLEHTRIFYFENGEDEELLYLSSADWMDRNFFSRVETCFPVEDRRLRQRIIQESLQGYLSDNAQAWLLQPDGSYRRVSAGNARRRSAQETLLKSLAERA